MRLAGRGGREGKRKEGKGKQGKGTGGKGSHDGNKALEEYSYWI